MKLIRLTSISGNFVWTNMDKIQFVFRKNHEGENCSCLYYDFDGKDVGDGFITVKESPEQIMAELKFLEGSHGC